jgi:magnesium transporter
VEDITREYLQVLEEEITGRKDDLLRARFEVLHPADIAEVLDHLSDEQVKYLWKLILKEERGDVLIELEEDVRETLLASLTNQEIAEEVLENIDSDDAADVVGELPDERAEEVIAQLDTEDREDLLTLLRCPEGTAGALMGTELIRVELDWTVAQAIREMRKQAENVETFHSVYVVNAAGQILGRLSLKRLLLTASSTRSTIGDLFQKDDTKTVKVDDPDEKVVQLMKKYDLVALPVVDDHNRLLGRITIDDVVDLMEEEAEKDYQLASGISDDVESDDALWDITRARLPWLLIGLFGGLAGAYVIGIFDIERFPSLYSAHCSHGRKRRRSIRRHCCARSGYRQKPHRFALAPSLAQRTFSCPSERRHLLLGHFGRQPEFGLRTEPLSHRQHVSYRRDCLCGTVWYIRALDAR